MTGKNWDFWDLYSCWTSCSNVFLRRKWRKWDTVSLWIYLIGFCSSVVYVIFCFICGPFYRLKFHDIRVLRKRKQCHFSNAVAITYKTRKFYQQICTCESPTSSLNMVHASKFTCFASKLKLTPVNCVSALTHSYRWWRYLLNIYFCTHQFSTALCRIFSTFKWGNRSYADAFYFWHIGTQFSAKSP